MQSLIDAVRSVLGEPEFYVQSGSYNQWDYGAMTEYMVCAIILVVVVSSIFRILVNWSR